LEHATRNFHLCLRPRQPDAAGRACRAAWTARPGGGRQPAPDREADPAQDRQLEIRSALGAHTTSLDDPETHPKFQFILAAAAALPIVSSGLTIEVTSEFSDQIGFGSSAAVTVATVAALRRFDGLPTDPRTILEAARAIIRSVQGRGSGADVAASVYGGMVLYRADPLEVTPRASRPCIR
jgi:mevalonate kinase